nr:leucine-rich repeat and death domain-containing protein 1 isoform X3 [Anser cygnoides]
MSHEVPKADQESRKMTENESKSDIPGKKHEYESSAERNASTVPQGVPEAGVRKLTFASDTNDTGELNQELSEAVNADARPDTLSSAENPESAEKGSTFLMPEEKDENFTLRLNDKGLQDTPLLTFESQNLKRLFLHNNELKTLHLNVGNLTNLEILLLERNRLTCLPPEISFLHKLTVLNVSHNQLLYLPKEFSKLVNLKELFLNHNNMDEFPFALRSLETLELAGNKLKTLPDAMADMEKLKVFNIDSNHFSIFPRVLCYLPNLVKLSICQNSIQSLPKDIKELKKLEEFSISNNKLIFLPVQFFQLTKLKELRADDNKLEFLSDKVENLRELRFLNLAKNLFKSLTDNLCNCTMLKHLIIHDNQLTQLPANIHRLRNLKEFSVSRNQLDSLDEQVSYLKDLSKIELSGNALTHIPVELKDCIQITKADLSYNKLSQFPNALCALFDLKYLNLSGNSISEIIPGISDIKDLEHLELNKNKLSSFSACLCSLTKLVYLDLSENEISNIPAVVSEMKALRVLLLHHNKFDSFPEELCTLKFLKALDISNNQIKTIPLKISNLEAIKDLNVSDNQFASFPSEICHLSSLEKLTLSQMHGLKLTQIPEELSKLVCLRELDISHNALKEMPDSIGELEYLVHLIANNNDISQLPKSITSLRNLQHLDLSENRLKSLPAGLHHLHLLKDINFDGNFLFEPLKDLCRGKQLHPILCYLESANERDEKILRKMIEVIADNVASEDFEFFCQKLQLRQADIKSLENTRTLKLKEKIIKALDIWISENQDLTYAEMVDKLIRILKYPPYISSNIPFLGHAIAFGKSPIEFLENAYDKYGPVFSFTMVGKTFTYLLGSDAAALLFNSKNEDLNAEDVYSRLTTPVFGKGVAYDVPNAVFLEQKKMLKTGLNIAQFKQHVSVIEEETREYFKAWGESGEKNLFEALSELIILTASHCLHGKEIRSLLNEKVAQLYADLDGGFTHAAWLLPGWLPLPSFRRRDRAHKEIKNIFYKVIQKRRNSEEKEDDMLQTLLDASYKDGRPLTDDEIAGMLIGLLLAGQHTSSTTSAWLGFFIARDKSIQEQCYAEQKAVCGDDLPPLTYDQLKDLSLLDRCLKETLRLRPPIMTMMRMAKTPQTVAGYSIPPGHQVCVSPTVNHRLRDSWKDALDFKPDRYLQDNPAAGEKFAYVPFGAGRHRCIGENFAYVQIKTIWSTLLRLYEFDLINDYFPTINYTTMIHTPNNPIIRYKRRSL